MNEKVIIAKVFIVDKDGLILAIRRSKTDPRRPLTWEVPGGIVEYGEDPNIAASRELEEETGLAGTDLKVFNVITIINKDKQYIIRLFYYAKTDNKDVRLSYEHDQCKWVTREDFNNLDSPDYFKLAMKNLPN